MRDSPLIEVLRANDATAMEQRMAAETIEQLHAELTRMKIVESGSIEEIAHANKTIEQLQARCKELDKELKRVQAHHRRTRIKAEGAFLELAKARRKLEKIAQDHNI